MSNSPILIGNDHGGYELKCAVIEYLTQRNIPVCNVGTDSTEVVRYPYYAAQVAGPISRGEAERGILICSTGIGMSIIANRYPGVRASLCTSTYMGKMTRAHNDSNLLCLGGENYRRARSARYPRCLAHHPLRRGKALHFARADSGSRDRALDR